MCSTKFYFWKRKLSLITLIFIHPMLFPIYCVSMKSAKFTLMDSSIYNKRFDTNLIVENVNYTKLKCMSICLNDVSCEFVGYHRDQRKCRLHSALVSIYGGVSENGWKYYSIREDFCPMANFIHNRIVDVCYTTFPGLNPCSTSKTMCFNLSANLLTVNSQTKQDWARDLSESSNIDGTFFDIYFDNIGQVWKLGSTGMEPTYTNWDTGQPDLRGTCVGMNQAHGWRWHDYEAHLETGIICEIRRP